MQILLNLFIFCLVLFLYLHIYFNLNTSNDLEIYEINEPSKLRLDEVCDAKQPVVFEYPNDIILSTFTKQNLSRQYGVFDIKVRQTNKKIEENDQMHIPLTLNNGIKVIENEDKKCIIENNNDFLKETGLVKVLKHNDFFIRPPMVSQCNYDFLIGSGHVKTPLKYDINYRNYFIVTEGNAKIKLAPPRSSKYLYEIKDYENFEFRSPVNPWEVQDMYKTDFSKIKFLEVELKTKQIINIPPYWWYSIEFDDNTTILKLTYKTYMNTISIMPKLIMKILQNQNIKRKIANTLNNCLDGEINSLLEK